LPDTRVIRQLKRAYRADSDPSGAYGSIVESRWASLAANLTNNRSGGLDGYISNTPGVDTLRSLRMPGPRATVTLSPSAEALRRSQMRAMANYHQAEIQVDTAAPPEDTDAATN
jgi:hypothetical protein